ncbi:uncharacterized protein GJ701_013299 isoform 1-T2 [Geothlypis trichas]
MEGPWHRVPREAVAAPSLDSVQGQAGGGLEQLGLVKCVSGHGSWVEEDELLRFLPSQTIQGLHGSNQRSQKHLYPGSGRELTTFLEQSPLTLPNSSPLFNAPHGPSFPLLELLQPLRRRRRGAELPHSPTPRTKDEPREPRGGTPRGPGPVQPISPRPAPATRTVPLPPLVTHQGALRSRLPSGARACARAGRECGERREWDGNGLRGLGPQAARALVLILFSFSFSSSPPSPPLPAGRVPATVQAVRSSEETRTLQIIQRHSFSPHGARESPQERLTRDGAGSAAGWRHPRASHPPPARLTPPPVPPLRLLFSSLLG